VHQFDRSVVHFGMPTTLPRIQVTVDDPLAEVLTQERVRRPGVPDSVIIRDLVVAEHQRRKRKAAAARLVAANLNYPDGYLDELRSDWPE
jgi:hypothetical protein